MISGLHLDSNVFKGAERSFWAIGAANVVAPMTLGFLAGGLILARHPDELLPGVTKGEFMAAVGISVSMKALPVLSAILGEMNLHGRRVGNLASSGTLVFTPYSSPGLVNPSGDTKTSLSTRSGFRAAKVQAIRPPIELPTMLARDTPNRSINSIRTSTLRRSV